MNKHIIFHLPFQIDPNRASASQIRPVKMLNAFKEIGYEVDVIMGNVTERKKQISAIREKIMKGTKYEFLYSESSTMPTLLTESHHLPLNPLTDFSFFSFCKKRGIPIGLFYRDIYWKYPEYKKEVGKLKSQFSILFYKWDLLKYRKLLDVLFLPSIQMSQQLPSLKRVKKYGLPSGASLVNLKSVNTSPKMRYKILYVGGLNDFYDLKMFTKIISQHNNEFLFTICCREDEWKVVSKEYSEFLLSGNISIVHESGQGLVSLYEAADFACLFVKGSEYRNFAMPFKLFEYLGMRKPIIATKDTAVGEFVEKNQIGWVSDYDENSLKKTLKEIIEAPNLVREIRLNIENSIKINTWSHRAKEVRDILLK